MWPVITQPWYFNAPLGLPLMKAVTFLWLTHSMTEFRNLHRMARSLLNGEAVAAETGQFLDPGAIAIDGGTVSLSLTHLIIASRSLRPMESC